MTLLFLESYQLNIQPFKGSESLPTRGAGRAGEIANSSTFRSNEKDNNGPRGEAHPGGRLALNRPWDAGKVGWRCVT